MRQFIKEHKDISTLLLLAIIGLYVYIFTNRSPELFKYGKELMDVAYGVSLSIVAATIFYILQVYVPSKKKQEILKSNFKSQCKQFKNDCIAIFLSASGSPYDSDLVRSLSDIHNFRKYFEEYVEDGQTRWHKVLNGIDYDNSKNLKDLFIQFEILSQEVDFFLDHMRIDDKNVFSFLKRLKQSCILLSNIDLDYDEIKVLSRFYWEIFAGWNFISGYKDEDIFEEILLKF